MIRADRAGLALPVCARIAARLNTGLLNQGTPIGKNFSGDIQCDGYVAYKTYAKTNALVKLLACLAHIRRNFFEVLDAGRDPDAAQILSFIGELCGIEAELSAMGTSPTHRHTEHAGHLAAVIYTLVENCRRHGIPVEEYLCELLTRLPGETDQEIYASLTPARKAAPPASKNPPPPESRQGGSVSFAYGNVEVFDGQRGQTC